MWPASIFKACKELLKSRGCAVADTGNNPMGLRSKVSYIFNSGPRTPNLFFYRFYGFLGNWVVIHGFRVELACINHFVMVRIFDSGPNSCPI